MVFCFAPVLAQQGAQMSALPQERDKVRLYHTREERREAGLHRNLTPWLTFSGLAELEARRGTFGFADGSGDLVEKESDGNLQIGLDLHPLEGLIGELVLEYEADFERGVDELFVEEATVAFERGPWELLAGRQYLPFGQYFSNFPTGPILELGETLEDALTLTYEFGGGASEVSASVYQGVADQIDSDGQGIDWTLAVELVPHQRLGLGASFLTDLGDAGGRLLADRDNRFVSKVPGLSAYLIWIGDELESTFEVVAAQRSFEGLAPDRDRPLAWNLELSVEALPTVALAVRVEGSRELEAFPEIQYGIASTILLHKNATLTLEYLHGTYKNDLATDDDGEPFQDVTRIGAQISIAF